MSSLAMRINSVVASVALLGFVGCVSEAPRVEAPGIDAAVASADALSQYDTNKDGFIAGAELDAVPALKSVLDTLDQDKDKKVSAAEIEARIAAWQETMSGRNSLVITVTKGGKPLGGVDVQFVPESFLGAEVLQAEGVTDDFGQADMNIPASIDPQDGFGGVQCGWYRVEITKDGASVSSKNLGLEVSPIAQNDPGKGVVFEL